MALANEWWDSTLFKLTQKQNEYVTHPEPRPHPISLKKANSTQLNLTGNETTKITHANKTTGGAVKETSKIGWCSTKIINFNICQAIFEVEWSPVELSDWLIVILEHGLLPRNQSSWYIFRSLPFRETRVFKLQNATKKKSLS